MNFTYNIDTQNKQSQTVTVVYTPDTFPESLQALPTLRIVNYDPSDTQEMLRARILAACPIHEWESALAVESPDFELGGGAGSLGEVNAAIESLTPTLTPEQEVHELKLRIAEARYFQETGGMNINGIRIDTDRESQSLLTGACLQAMRNPSYELKWKTAIGFVTLTAAEIISIAESVREHVQACFDREAELVAEVEVGTFESEMLNEGWPVYSFDNGV